MRLSTAAAGIKHRLKRWGPQALRSPLARIALAWCVVSLPAFGLAALLGQDASPLSQLLRPLLVTALSLAAYCGYVRLVERRRPAELAVAGAWAESGAGLLIGALAFGLVMTILAASGAYQVEGHNRWAELALNVPRFVQGAVTEEILFRAILFRILEQRFGSSAALLASALLFGALHLSNPAATLFNAAAIAIEAGLMLAAAYMLTGRLWLCIAIHFAWNFVQGPVCSVAVSGYAQQGFLIGRLDGPDWLTGGSFGAEASLAAVAVCTVSGVVLLTLARDAGRFVPAGRR
jgi:membrane protease YdiL (CAAX protease family)